MRFGPAPAPAETQSYVATMFGDLYHRDGNRFVSPRVDDLSVSISTFEEHVDNVEVVPAGGQVQYGV